MLFNSFGFLFAFLPATALIWWLLVGRTRSVFAILFLLSASYYFYLSGEKFYPWLLAGSILFNYSISHLIAKAEGRFRSRALWFGVIVNLGVLALFKYSKFIIAQLDPAFPLSRWNIMLPVGISFYTFTQIAYLADVAQKKIVPPDVARYGLFVSYFPHLIAGPILHNKEMLPQFENPERRRLAIDLFSGLAMLAIGLAKKVLLADPCGSVASSIFSGSGGPPALATAWIAAIAYTLQIYFDFSGYSDMAIGMSRMLGIDLPINFNSPYKSRSIIEFWRRWHITLSRFLRDYLYIPLGGNRLGEARRFFNLFATMLIGGIWHGAGWTFIIWGALHGFAQTVAHGWVALGRTVRLPAIPRRVGWLMTLLFVIIAWVPFRATSLAATMTIWKGMVGGNGLAWPDITLFRPVARALHGQLIPASFGSGDVALMVLTAGIALYAPNSQQLLSRFDLGLDSPGYNAKNTAPRYAIGLNWQSMVIVAILLGMTLRAIGGYSEFIYFQF